MTQSLGAHDLTGREDAAHEAIEIIITSDSPAAGRKLHDVAWPPASTLVSVLRGRRFSPAHPETPPAAGDRVSLLIPAPAGSPPQHSASPRPDGHSRGQTSSEGST